jgi:hypothetical protein
MKSEIPNGSLSAAGPQLEALSLPAFDGFPYISTRLVPALYHLIVVPRSFEKALLRDVTRRQVSANRLPTCLVLSDTECYYYETVNGRESATSVIPRGGRIVSGKLQLCIPVEQDDEIVARQRLLSAYQDERNRGGGHILGDLTKGGRDATVAERLRLMGRQTNGVPAGLIPCVTCGAWRGHCLDPNPRFKDKVMEVHCFCANDNLCAACGSVLYARKLNANYFGESDGQIWHVPGFSGLSHQCAEVRQ